MNLPNTLSLIRILLVPVFIALFFITPIAPLNYLLACIVFCLAAITDFLDGYIARKYNLVTTLGKFLDPIADKILVSSALIVLVSVMPEGYVKTSFTIAVCVIMARELMVSAFRQIAATKNFVMAADMAGKIKTVFQDFAIIILLLWQFTASEVVFYVGVALTGIATVLTIISAVNYLIKNKAVLKND